LTTDPDPRGDIAVDGVNVYWTSGSDIYRVPVTGGARERLQETNPFTPNSVVGDMVLRGNALYWTISGTLMKRSLDGTAAGTAIGTGSSSPGALAVDSSYAYWTGGTPIHRTPIGGGTTIDLVTGTDALYLAADGTNVYWADYGADFGMDAVLSLPVGGGTPLPLVPNLVNPGPIAADGTNVYFGSTPSNSNGTAISKVPVGGGTAVMLGETSGKAYDIAIDAAHVYWVEIGGYIKRVPIAGGAVVTLASGQAAPIRLALDQTSVYWVNTNLGGGAGAVMKVAK
jgi:hypothetical protein